MIKSRRRIPDTRASPSQSVHRILSLPPTGWQVLGAGLNCSEIKPDVRFTLKADIRADVSLSPLCAKTGCEQSQQMTQLFDHLVGAGEQRWRHFEAERSGGPEIDDEFDSGRLLHRQVGGLRTLENAAGVVADLAI